MKKHLVVIMNIVLILAIVGAIVFTVVNSLNRKNEPVPVATEATAAETVAETAAAPTIPADRTFKIGIIQHGLGKASKDCYEGFITELNESGMLNNCEIVYIVEDNEELCRDKIKNLITDGCDLLYTIGRFASEEAAAATKDVPIVFGAVNSPDEIGLVESNETPGGNVTGVSNYTPCFEQIDLIPTLLPSTKSIAAIYTNTDASSVSQGIIASKEAEQIGLTCTQYPVTNETDLNQALTKIKEEKSDAIYIPVDKFLSSHIGMLNEFSQANKIPVICGDEATLEQGAFATSVINYNSIGRRAADMAVSILANGQSPATLSVAYKHDCNNLVNKETMEKLGIKLNANALNQVELRTKPTEAE